jgi:DNA polymerase/3'-5' exonuclease PolX
MGLTLNEYALSRIDNEEVASKTEEDIYHALKLD